MQPFSRWFGRAGRLLGLGCLTLVLSAPVWAQCAMCREAAANQRAEATQALNRGIILLLIPPIAIMAGIAFLTYRYRNSYRGQRVVKQKKEHRFDPTGYDRWMVLPERAVRRRHHP